MAEGDGGQTEGDFDPLFTLDVVRDFMMSQGGKVNNTTLVTHFRTFLNDPRRKVRVPWSIPRDVKLVLGRIS